MKRRQFSKYALTTGIGLGLGAYACKNSNSSCHTEHQPLFFKLSLAQWSLHRNIKELGMDPFQFAHKGRQLGFEGLEYVSSLYFPFLDTFDHKLSGLKKMSNLLKEKSATHGMQNVLIMVDEEGDLATQSAIDREKAIENHYKWIDMASELGCASIRLNLYGDGSEEAQHHASVLSLKNISHYAKDLNVNVLVENHGGHSSNPVWLTKVMEEVNMDNCGLLPDFGNFCIEREGGQRWGTACVNEYKDIYGAIDMMMPYAKAISAKSYAFDDQGNEKTIDYSKMLNIIASHNYDGFISVEFEGAELDEIDGILKTKELLIRHGKKS